MYIYICINLEVGNTRSIQHFLFLIRSFNFLMLILYCISCHIQLVELQLHHVHMIHQPPTKWLIHIIYTLQVLTSWGTSSYLVCYGSKVNNWWSFCAKHCGKLACHLLSRWLGWWLRLVRLLGLWFSYQLVILTQPGIAHVFFRTLANWAWLMTLLLH